MVYSSRCCVTRPGVSRTNVEEITEKSTEIESLRSALKLKNKYSENKNKNFDPELESEIQKTFDEIEDLLNKEPTKVQVSSKNDISTKNMTDIHPSGPIPETVVINQCEKGPKEYKPKP